MKETLLVVQNIATQSPKAQEDIIEAVGMVRESLEEVFTAIKEGEQL